MNNYFRTGFFLLAGMFFYQHVDAASPQEMNVPKKLRKTLKSFEPSAVIQLEDSYLIAVDDTDDANSPMLFLMDSEGNIEEEPVTIEGLESITDIESLSKDGRYIYMMSSQSKNKKGKVQRDRNLFVRGVYSEHAVSSTEVVVLRPLLLDALLKSKEPTIVSIQEGIEDSLEIESSFVRDGHLHVGLKEPRAEDGAALVLDLGEVDSIFQKQRIVSDAIKVAFRFKIGSDHRLSDMIIYGDHFLLTSTLDEGNAGTLWSYDEKNKELKEIQSYQEGRPEGIAPGKSANEILVVFDQGDETPLFIFEPR